MKCPHCHRENRFPVPGLCPDCYRLWKERMRARHGPGPWPAYSADRDLAHEEEIDAGLLQEESPLAENRHFSTMQRCIEAVLAQLDETEPTDQGFLEQLDWVLRKVVHMMVCSVTEPGRHHAE
jgi:hypothetical protein